MTTATASDEDYLHFVASTVYAQVAPQLGCHSPCREGALVVLGAAAALGIGCELVHDPNYREGGLTTPHYQVVLPSGRRIDVWQRQMRLLPEPDYIVA